MPLLNTSGNVTSDAYGGGVAVEPNYIESVFSCFLYTGNDSTQTITNGIDLSGKGGLVWIKARNTGSTFNCLFDTARGATKALFSNATNSQGTYADTLTSFNTTGFTLGADTTTNFVNAPTGQTEVSWTFRKQPKFFDVVTYTGTGSVQNIAHNLGSVPGCMIVKGITQTSAGNWNVYHTSVGNGSRLLLNTTDATLSAATTWNNTDPTSTQFTVGTSSQINASGNTYVAYLFAHNAGGFGLTGTDNVISCGSYTGNGSATGPIVTLGYEPQWVMVKNTGASLGDWNMADNLRGMAVNDTTTFNTQRLRANLSSAEGQSGWISPTATGFQIIGGNASNSNYNASGETYIYIAIRRGPMKVPTSGTSVFSPNRWTSTVGSAITTNFPLDLQISKWMGVGGDSNFVQDRLRGLNTVTTNSAQPYLLTESTAAEGTNSGANYNFGNTGFLVGDNDSANGWAINFRRAPSFFDEVCYTGNGTNLSITHNLQAVPELIILKYRDGTSYGWKVTATGLTNPNTYYLGLNSTNAESNYTANFIYNRTSTTFTVVSDLAQSGWNWVAYLFATCAGVSKVFSFTGNGTTQTINCGFAGGARFVLLKASSATGGWYVYDTARGMTTLTDPYLQLNSTAAETATLGSVTTVTTGFAVNEAITTGVNTNGVTYIGLAIA